MPTFHYIIGARQFLLRPKVHIPQPMRIPGLNQCRANLLSTNIICFIKIFEKWFNFIWCNLVQWFECVTYMVSRQNLRRQNILRQNGHVKTYITENEHTTKPGTCTCICTSTVHVCQCYECHTLIVNVFRTRAPDDRGWWPSIKCCSRYLIGLIF